MRTNEHNPGIILKHANDLAPKEVRGSYKFSPRKKAIGEALSPSQDLFLRSVYQTGDGDPQSKAMQRAGSDHSHIKSFGF